jgi:DNA-binding transcriptional LysR family regulator
MDPRRLLTFRAVARERSFTRAAETLALTQPSVSQQVAALEAEVGARLLNRGPGGLTLTPDGELLLEHADAIATRLELARRQLTERVASTRAQLRIGAFPTALADLVPTALERLTARHDDIAITVEEVGSEQAGARVAAGDLHLALAFQDAAAERREPEQLERRDLLRERFLVALPEGHRLAAREAIALSELAGEAWTVPSPSGLLVRACRQAGFEPRIVSITREQAAIRGLVRRGLAVTLAPALLAGAFEDLALRPIAGAGPERTIYALLPPSGRHPLANELLDDLADQTAGLSGPTTRQRRARARA